MTDYVPLIARAVAELDKNTGASRRALYERARTALVAQLRKLDPPLTESEVTRERLALEEAIRKTEAETARQARPEPRRQTSSERQASADQRVSIAPKKPEKALPLRNPPPETLSPQPQEPSWAIAADTMEQVPATGSAEAQPLHPDLWEQPDPPPWKSVNSRPPRTSVPEEEPQDAHNGADVLKGFRELVAQIEQPDLGAEEASRLGPMPRVRGLRGTRERPEHVFDRAPAPNPAFQFATADERREAGKFGELADTPVDLDGFEPIDFPDWESPGQRERELSGTDSRPEPAWSSASLRDAEEETAPKLRRSRQPLLLGLLGAVLVVAAAGGLYGKRDALRAWFVKGPPAQAQRDVTAARPKIADRVGQAAQSSAPALSEAAQPMAPVAEQVVLYEDDPSATDPQGKRYVGTVVWRTETMPAAPGQSPDLAIKAQMEIPDRHISMSMSVRRNADKALPATHTIEIMFNLPADFPFGGISNVPGILMKEAEQTRGSPLAGLAVKVTAGFFLVGLSSSETDVQRNMELLKDRGWFDIPLVYNNGRRAILAVEKGTPGDRAFKEAFATWGE